MCVCVCVRACVRACVRVCVCGLGVVIIAAVTVVVAVADGDCCAVLAAVVVVFDGGYFTDTAGSEGGVSVGVYARGRAMSHQRVIRQHPSRPSACPHRPAASLTQPSSARARHVWPSASSAAFH